jgi:hypothetical protein
MTVEVGGRIRQLPTEHDFTGDGQPDAAVETGDGRVIVFADTEDNTTGGGGPDGRADQAYVVDKATGRVVGAAHVDPGTGAWIDESVVPAVEAPAEPAWEAPAEPAGGPAGETAGESAGDAAGHAAGHAAGESAGESGSGS